MKVGILTGGGDCPGLNPAIQGAVLKGIDFGFEFVGILEGWKGLLEAKTVPLALSDVEEIINKGGTILGTSRTNPFKVEGGPEKCMENFKKLGLDALIAMGGEDTLGVANRFYNEYKMNVVGVPKTMDNDLNATDYTFGFDSSVTVAVDAAERLKDTGKSHRRIMVLEVMGRHAGWVALFTAIASGADWVMLPEEDTNIDKMCEHLKKVYERKKTALVIVSEGAKFEGVEEEVGEKDAFGHTILQKRGLAQRVADVIKEKTKIEVRSAVIGHIQRGGAPTLFDRILGFRCGVKAAELVKNGEFGKMAAMRGKDIIAVPLSDAVSNLKVVDKYWIDLVKTIFK
ncbi:MAG: 6-phosphofructokinase [Caldiserica bacterium]|nr:MAG: 6-phosphofructokinase [Caldisericota bacterium]